jgi:hypothetical protein
MFKSWPLKEGCSAAFCVRSSVSCIRSSFLAVWCILLFSLFIAHVLYYMQSIYNYMKHVQRFFSFFFRYHHVIMEYLSLKDYGVHLVVISNFMYQSYQNQLSLQVLVSQLKLRLHLLLPQPITSCLYQVTVTRGPCCATCQP